MHQENKRYYELAEKWLNGTITKEEMSKFSEWYNDNEDGIVDIPEEFAESEDHLRKRILLQINRQRKPPMPVFSLRNSVFIKLAAASVLISAGMFSLFYLMSDKEPSRENTIITKAIPDDTVLPGGNKATLILGDGTKLILDTATAGTIAQDDYTRVIKLDDGQLAYTSADDRKGPPTYNTLTTPRGGQYAITLTDGTRVWLNSSSSLRFPSAFKDEERTVELNGEGYFEVAHDPSRPFKVNVNGMEVKVFGTHFNIMAYNDESTINTTLLEGSVMVRRQKDIALLKPGQQVKIDPSGKIEIIKKADVEQAVAWKNGVFDFNGSDIQTTMRQIARWYDIKVTYGSNITEHFNGTIVRNASIERVLKMLEYTGVVHFDMVGRNVFVRPQKD
jgi:ferric-dicitrate binding protein FerR (iron transport regulator)